MVTYKYIFPDVQSKAYNTGTHYTGKNITDKGKDISVKCYIYML